jgi:hypothetical protein
VRARARERVYWEHDSSNYTTGGLHLRRAPPQAQSSERERERARARARERDELRRALKNTLFMLEGSPGDELVGDADSLVRSLACSLSSLLFSSLLLFSLSLSLSLSLPLSPWSDNAVGDARRSSAEMLSILTSYGAQMS